MAPKEQSIERISKIIIGNKFGDEHEPTSEFIEFIKSLGMPSMPLYK